MLLALLKFYNATAIDPNTHQSYNVPYIHKDAQIHEGPSQVQNELSLEFKPLKTAITEYKIAITDASLSSNTQLIALMNYFEKIGESSISFAPMACPYLADDLQLYDGPDLVNYLRISNERGTGPVGNNPLKNALRVLPLQKAIADFVLDIASINLSQYEERIKDTCATYKITPWNSTDTAPKACQLHRAQQQQFVIREQSNFQTVVRTLGVMPESILTRYAPEILLGLFYSSTRVISDVSRRVGDGKITAWRGLLEMGIYAGISVALYRPYSESEHVHNMTSYIGFNPNFVALNLACYNSRMITRVISSSATTVTKILQRRARRNVAPSFVLRNMEEGHASVTQNSGSTNTNTNTNRGR